MIIESTYRDRGEQFQLKVVGEDAETYTVVLLPEFQSQFQEKDKATKLRKDLIGAIYKIVEEQKEEQISIFDLLGEEQ